ncbi:MAG: Wzz/FepE/Etk N-terminal domain-containing protein [Gammaproteobacteria bacterium]|nr:Wzz/FepE/Etk N-terminal domain-containing protein [Gammaproteobacteria bacterium]
MTTSKQNNTQQPTPQPDACQWVPDDEISLIDVWLLLTRRRIMIGLILVICLLAGGGYALLAEPKYEYKSLLEIGQTPLGTLNEPEMADIENPATVEAKLNSSGISRARQMATDTLDRPSTTPEANISRPKGTGLILVTSTAPSADYTLVQNLHETLLNQVVDEHAALTGATLARYQAQLAVEQNRLEQYIKDPQTSAYIRDMQRQKVDQLVALIENMRPTRIIQIAAQSEKPTSPGKAAILALSGLLGLMVGVFMAFLAEFLANARRELLSRETES